jgi:cytochrome c oxidase subunit I
MSPRYPDTESLSRSERNALNLYLVSALMLFLLLMSFGLTMRLAQSAWIAIGPDVFYQIMPAWSAPSGWPRAPSCGSSCGSTCG